MATKVFEHRGHRVTVATQANEGRFSWQFQIDDEDPVALMVSSAKNEAGAEAEARSAAISIVDLREGLD